MEHLTRAKAHKLHKQLWSWLAKNPTAYKSAWTGWAEFGPDATQITHSCFPCELRRQQHNHQGADLTCLTECMFIWPDGNTDCVHTHFYFHGGLFYRWSEAHLPEVRTKLALQIRDLPLRPLKRTRKPTTKKGATK